MSGKSGTPLVQLIREAMTQSPRQPATSMWLKGMQQKHPGEYKMARGERGSGNAGRQMPGSNGAF